jgi:hypothetical protein
LEQAVIDSRTNFGPKLCFFTTLRHYLEKIAAIKVKRIADAIINPGPVLKTVI